MNKENASKLWKIIQEAGEKINELDLNKKDRIDVIATSFMINDKLLDLLKSN
jgi:hypothetical protein